MLQLQTAVARHVLACSAQALHQQASKYQLCICKSLGGSTAASGCQFWQSVLCRAGSQHGQQLWQQSQQHQHGVFSDLLATISSLHHAVQTALGRRRQADATPLLHRRSYSKCTSATSQVSRQSGICIWPYLLNHTLEQQPRGLMARRCQQPLSCCRASSTSAATPSCPSYGSSSSSGSYTDYSLDQIHSITHEQITSGALQSSNLNTDKVIAVAMSGGVDSAVSAMLLKRLGYRTFGVYMHNWDASDEAGSCAPTCTSAADLEDAKLVCAALDMPLYEADFVSKYWNSVFSHFLEGIERGLTPNPDLACNSHIKFGALLRFAQEKGADVLATGHYARLAWRSAPTPPLIAADSASGSGSSDSSGASLQAPDRTDGIQHLQQPVLLTGSDTSKDQTYFLAGVNQQQLAKAMFPVGHLTKAQVRDIAAAADLPMSSKRSSAGICFIGRRSFGRFLEDYIPPAAGVYVDVDSGEVLGKCSNMFAVTVGQRALGLGGQQERVYVAGKDMHSGTVHVARGHHHPALYSSTVLLESLNWISRSPFLAAVSTTGASVTGGSANGSSTAVLHCSFKARYRQSSAACTVRPIMRGEQFKASKFCSHAAESELQQNPIGAAAAAEAHSSRRSTPVSAGVGNGREARVVAAAAGVPGRGAVAEQLQRWVAELTEPLRGVTPGQAFVLYDRDVCLGSAVIVAHGRTLAEL